MIHDKGEHGIDSTNSKTHVAFKGADNQTPVNVFFYLNNLTLMRRTFEIIAFVVVYNYAVQFSQVFTVIRPFGKQPGGM